jgi:hypothetical protein
MSALKVYIFPNFPQPSPPSTRQNKIKTRPEQHQNKIRPI